MGKFIVAEKAILMAIHKFIITSLLWFVKYKHRK
jgi:hypothetical protein